MATAHAGGTNSNQDTETVTAVQTHGADAGQVGDAGDLLDALAQSISYSYLVTNTRQRAAWRAR